jgi:hypothetical protein
MSNADNEDFGSLPTAPYGVPDNSFGGPGSVGPGQGGGKSARRSWSRGKRAAALLGVCAVAGGGAFAVTQAAGGQTATTATTTGFQAGTSASITGQASTLSSALSVKGVGRLARLRRLGGMYGQYTFVTKTGSHTLAFERGTITSVSSSDVVIRAANGTSWTWDLTSTSVVREDGKKPAENTLAGGQLVFTAGPVTNGARDARVIVIRKAAAPSSPS